MSRNFKVSFNPRDLVKFQKNLEFLIGKVERTAKREALTKAARPMLKAAKSLAPVRDRHLQKSLKVKISTFQRDEMIIATIGPDRQYRATRTDEEGNPQRVRPVYYAHLLEFGTHRMPAQPYMRPAFDSTKGVSLKIYAGEIKAAIKRVAKRFRNQRRFA